MYRIKGVATKFTYQGKLEVRIDKAQYDQLFDQFSYYLCRNFNRPPPCLVRHDYEGGNRRYRRYYICLTINKLDRKEDFLTLLGLDVTANYKLRAYNSGGASGLAAQLIDVSPLERSGNVRETTKHPFPDF